MGWGGRLFLVSESDLGISGRCLLYSRLRLGEGGIHFLFFLRCMGEGHLFLFFSKSRLGQRERLASASLRLAGERGDGNHFCFLQRTLGDFSD